MTKSSEEKQITRDAANKRRRDKAAADKAGTNVATIGPAEFAAKPPTTVFIGTLDLNTDILLDGQHCRVFSIAPEIVTVSVLENSPAGPKVEAYQRVVPPNTRVKKITP